VAFEILQGTDYIDSLAGMVNAVEQFSAEHNNATILLRGHFDSRWELKPTLGREYRHADHRAPEGPPRIADALQIGREQQQDRAERGRQRQHGKDRFRRLPFRAEYEIDDLRRRRADAEEPPLP